MLTAIARPAVLDREQRPILVVVVDTEEEFDWTRGHDPAATGVASMRKIERVQRIFDLYGIVPTYAIDWPVATQRDGWGPLRELQRAGRALVGAHLHPWVNPPRPEVGSVRLTYPGNLPEELEREKVRSLVLEIGERFEEAPRVYKAGRYGFGPNTAGILGDLGFEVDASFCPGFDLTEDGGPDYSLEDCSPSWLSDGLLEVPCTGALVGPFSTRRARDLHALAHRVGLRVPGLLARLGVVDRLMLSPEGYTPAEHRKLTRHLLARGGRVFSWTFHSPSVEVGHTPYVQSRAELEAFLDSFRRYFDHFFGDLGGVAMTPLELRRHLEGVT